MNYLKTYESFENIHFLDIVRDKLLELEDIGFETFVQDDKDLSLLEKMIRITIRRKNNRTLFDFTDCKDLIVDILLTNKELNTFKEYHVIITYNDTINRKQSLNLYYDFNKEIFYMNVNILRSGNKTPISNISHIKYIEVFFE
jgi:hypothetical protein